MEPKESEPLKPFIDMVTASDAKKLVKWWSAWYRTRDLYAYTVMTSPSNSRFYAVYRIKR